MKIVRFQKLITKLGNVLIILCLLVLNSSLVQTAQAVAGDTIRVSVDSSGAQGNNSSGIFGDGGDISISISADGRYVAFLSGASNLVSGDTNGYADIFVRDIVANATTRVSIDSNGIEGNGSSAWPSISADGRYVAFVSDASNLVGGDTNGHHADVFVRDTVMNTTTLVSVDSSGIQGYDDARYSSISADGRYVAFLGTFASLQGTLIVMRDTLTNTTTPVSVELNGVPDGLSYSPSISANGRYVAYFSQASNVVSGDTNGSYDVFVRDTVANTTTRVSVDSSGVEANWGSMYPSISPDGRYVAFTSNAGNLVNGDTNGWYDIFVRDTVANTTTLVSVASSGAQGNGDSYFPSISANGRYVAFTSLASNLDSRDTNGTSNIFVRDTVANTTTLVSVDSNGAQGNSSSYHLSFSADGHYVAFSSGASNLVSGDTNGFWDVFAHENAISTTGFVISGNAGTATVTLSYTDGISKTTTSVADGSYSITVSNGWSGTVTPSKAGYTFAPSNRVYTNVQSNLTNQNYAAIATTYTISGNVGVGNAILTYTDGILKDATSAANGSYSFSVSNNWSGTVTPWKASYTFTPSNRVYTNVQSNQTAQNYTATQRKPPLIIVHGFQGLAFDILNPLILQGYHCTNDGYGADDVQLYDGTNSTLGDLPQMFYHDYEVWIAHLETTPLGTPPLETNAQCLRDQINTVYQLNSQPITIVSHSMGGVVSRAAIRYLDNPKMVKALYTLGSPHAGIPIEILALQYPKATGEICLIHLGGCQMAPTSMVNFNTWNPNVKDVQYNFIGGNGGKGTFDWYLRLNLQGPNDGLVGQYSAVGWVSPLNLFIPNWPDASWPRQYFTNETHPNFSPAEKAYYAYQDSQGFSDSFGCIDALIKGNTPDSNHCWRAGAQTPQAFSMTTSALSSSVSSSTEIKAGHLNAVQTVTLPFVIDSTGTTLFYLNWSGGNAPSFTLMRPDAQVINPAYAVAHPAEVTYEISSGNPESAAAATYSFVSSQIGTWQATITATDAIDYKILGLIDSTLQLTANTNAEVYQIGNVATITANLANGSAGVTGATVIAKLTRSDAVVSTISLTSQGNGTYSNTYTIPDVSGYLTIDVIATGSDNGTAFSHQKSLLVAIAPNDLQLTGNYNDQPRDVNVDGLYDYLDFTTQVNLATPGKYAVSAELYAGNQLITQYGDFFNLSAGIQTFTLPFDGDAIRAAGLNGPYTVKNLYLTPIDIGITATSVDNVWTTSAYSYAQFADKTSPIVSSIAPTDPNPTSSASVNFTVTFSESVTGVDTNAPINNNFALATTGVTGATVTGVSGSGVTYTVTVNTGSGNGTIRLDVVDDNSIVDAANNPLGGAGVGNGNYTSGEAYMTIKGFNNISKGTNAFDLSHGWTVSQYVRTTGDVNGDSKGDLIGFGLDGVYVALSNGTSFDAVSKWTSAFDLSHGWTVASYVRTVGDVNNDGKDDLVGFGQDGVYVALSNGTGFDPISKWTSAFDLSHGWTVANYVRTVGDVNNDGRVDLVGFGLDGVYVALSNGTSFDAVSKWTSAFDLSHGWTVKDYVRTVGDVNNDGRADLVGFGQDGVYVALSNGTSFDAVSKWTSAFDLAHGWTVKDYVRTVGDVNSDGRADLIGFGQDGVYIALSTGSGFTPVSKWTSAFDLSHGWTVAQFVRTVGDVSGDGKADLVGFGLDGVYIATSK